MPTFIFYILLFIIPVYASSNDDSLYDRHIKKTYASASLWSSASQDAITHAKMMIAKGGSFQEIVDSLAVRRASLPNALPGFGTLS